MAGRGVEVAVGGGVGVEGGTVGVGDAGTDVAVGCGGVTTDLVAGAGVAVTTITSAVGAAVGAVAPPAQALRITAATLAPMASTLPFILFHSFSRDDWAHDSQA